MNQIQQRPCQYSLPQRVASSKANHCLNQSPMGNAVQNQEHRHQGRICLCIRKPCSFIFSPNPRSLNRFLGLFIKQRELFDRALRVHQEVALSLFVRL